MITKADEVVLQLLHIGRLEAGNDLTVTVDKELSKIPFYIAVVLIILIFRIFHKKHPLGKGDSVLQLFYPLLHQLDLVLQDTVSVIVRCIQNAADLVCNWLCGLPTQGEGQKVRSV